MKKLILICAVLLLVQSGLAVWTYVANNPARGATSGKGPLLKNSTAEVNAVLLEDGEGHALHLTKEKDQWQLPTLASFPADTVRVQGLIDRIVGLQQGWPEATTLEAAKRFKVASDRFERKLTLRNKSTDLGVVYFGSSPGLRKTYIRVEGTPEIQAIALASHELEMRADAWIDTRVLHLKSEQVLRVALPGLQLERHKEGLQPTDLELEGGTSIEYTFAQSPVKTEAKEALGQLPEPPSYVLKVSNREQLFRIDGWQVDAISNGNRASLVQKKGKVQAGGGQPQQ